MASVAGVTCDNVRPRACQGGLQWGPEVHDGLKATFHRYWAQNKRCPFCRDDRCEFNALAEQYMQEGMVVAYTGVTLKRNGHVVEVGMQFTVEEVKHGDDPGTCVKLYNTGFGGPFWVPLTDVIAVAGDGVSDADVSKMQSAEPQKGEGCNRQSAISRMPRPHGTDLTRSFKCGGCRTHGRMPFENGICNQCHTALSITYDDVTIRHLFDAHLPGIVELRYRVLKDWTERCPIHKIAEQVINAAYLPTHL